MNDEPNCWTCAYSNFPETAEPCASCDMNFSHFESTESTESTDTAASEDARREAKMAGPTCLTCKHKGVSILEEPCISCVSCNGYRNYTPDESAPCAEGTDENDDVIEPCNTCTHRDNLRCNPPCSHCRQERGIEYPEYEEDKGDEEDVLSPALPVSTGTCPEPWDPVLPVSTRGAGPSPELRGSHGIRERRHCGFRGHRNCAEAYC